MKGFCCVSVGLLGAGEAGGGPRHGQPHQCLRIHGVLRQKQGRRAGGVRDGHQGGAAGQEGQEEQQVPAAVNRLRSPPFYLF